MLVTARWLLTGATPPLKDGAVLIEGEAIREIGVRRTFAKRDIEAVDLEDSILIPGLVNAHCHLEFSALKGVLAPRRPFTEWVKALQGEVQGLTSAEQEEGIDQGIQELLHGGTTTLVNHQSPEMELLKTPFRQFTFLEVLGANEERARRNLGLARHSLLKQEDSETSCQITPHSLYAVHPDIFAMLSSQAGQAPLSIHLLESEEEDRFFRHQAGPLAVYVQERGGDLNFPVSSPIKWLKANNGLARLLLVHGNYLTDEEIRLLRGSGAFVIHCPGSHRFFGHRPFPLNQLFQAEVPVALGTDSLASNDSLSMLQGMQLAKESFPSLGEEDILRMATWDGARALGLDHEIGTVEVGKKADLVGVPLLNKDVDPYEALLLADEVNFSMVGGRILTPLS